MARAQAKYEISARDKTKAAFKSVKRGLSNLKAQGIAAAKKIGAVGAGLAGIGGIGGGLALAGMLKSAAGLKSLSRQTGVAVKDIGKLQKVFATVGREDELPDFLFDLKERLQEAKVEPDSTPAKALARLGLDPKQFEKGGFQLVQALQGAFKKTGDLFSLREFLGDEAASGITAIQGVNVKESSKGSLVSEKQAKLSERILLEFNNLVKQVKDRLTSIALNPAFLNQLGTVILGVRSAFNASKTWGDLIVNLAERFKPVRDVIGLIFDSSAQISGAWDAIKMAISDAATAIQNAYDNFKIFIGGIIAAKNALNNFGSNLGTGAAEIINNIRQSSVGQAGAKVQAAGIEGASMLVPLLQKLVGFASETATNTKDGGVAVAG